LSTSFGYAEEVANCRVLSAIRKQVAQTESPSRLRGAEKALLCTESSIVGETPWAMSQENVEAIALGGASG